MEIYGGQVWSAARNMELDVCPGWSGALETLRSGEKDEVWTLFSEGPFLMTGRDCFG